MHIGKKRMRVYPLNFTVSDQNAAFWLQNQSVLRYFLIIRVLYLFKAKKTQPKLPKIFNVSYFLYMPPPKKNLKNHLFQSKQKCSTSFFLSLILSFDFNSHLKKEIVGYAVYSKETY